MRNLYLGLLCCFIIICGCNKPVLQNGQIPADALKNIAYGTHPSQVMDVYLPAGRSAAATPLVILLHGGAWQNGDKQDFDETQTVRIFQEAGYAVANLNFRPATVAPYPAQLEDVRGCVRLLQGRANSWGIDARRICLLGKSSGAHLALLYAAVYNSDKAIKTVVDFFGPADLTDSTITQNFLRPYAEVLMGSSYIKSPTAWMQASPVYHGGKAVPTYIIQGGVDSVVYPIHSEKLRDSLTAHAIPAYYLFYPQRGHGLSIDEWVQAQQLIINWIAPYMAK